MNSNFFNSLGLGSIDIGFILLGLLVISIVLLLLIIITFVQIGKLKKKYMKFMLGKDGANLEKDIMTLYEDNKYMKLSIDRNREDIKQLFKKHETTFQKVGLVKYDAFNEMGGKLSFAVALLDKNNNGWIMNAMHSREGCYTYIKEIIKGESYVELAEEEAEALDKAIFENYEMDVKDVKK